MAYIEQDVLEDVRDYLIDTLGAGYGGGDVLGGELWTVLFEEPNANGTLDFSRQVSLDYIDAHPAALDVTIRYMVEELGSLDWEDVYEWDEDKQEDSNREYVETYAEALKVSMFIFIGQVILQMCPIVEKHLNSIIDLGDPEVLNTLYEQLEQAPLSEVGEYF